MSAQHLDQIGPRVKQHPNIIFPKWSLYYDQELNIVESTNLMASILYLLIKFDKGAKLGKDAENLAIQI